MSAEGVQERFAGVIKIVRFNVQFYAISAAGLVVPCLLLVTRSMPRWLVELMLCGGAALAFWTLSSLVVSWYVYDYAGVTRWEWLPARLMFAPRRWVNIHSGLDESTTALRRLFPGSEGQVVDIYDATTMTEPSIARARRMFPASEPFASGRFDALPLPDADRDTVLLLFAAHEVRDPAQRGHLLRECGRVLKDDGQIVLVEHLRDWKNFVAFGPGFLHFHSSGEWRRNARVAGLRVDRESQATPFVRCFVLKKIDR